MIADISITEKSFGPKQLYKHLRFSVQLGEKVGLIGRNGVGKSTLFAILAGTDMDYSGEVVYRKGLVVVATRQEHHGLEETPVLEYILHDLPEYTRLKHIIDTYPTDMGDNMQKIATYSEALSRFDDLGYYTVEDSILRELAQVQIDEAKARGPLGSLSGGQKRLVEIVKIMHARAQLALIDEPTNHMDFSAKEHFIDWLKNASEAVLVITHDRDVLHEVDRIIEVKDGQAFSYSGNYDAYLRQNTVSTTSKMHEYEITQRQVSNLKTKIIQFRRLKEKARDPDTIKQFKRRENEAVAELAVLEKIEKPNFWIDKASSDNLNYKVGEHYQKYKAKNIRIATGSAESRSKRLLVEATDLSLGYSGALFSGVSFALRETERLELRGRNGAGKTTLVRAILAAHGNQPITTKLAGSLQVERHATIGVYEQEVSPQYFDLSLHEAIVQLHVDKGLKATNEIAMRLMSDYLFDPQIDGSTLVRQLSGGQKARFQLIAMLATKPQLLILDEPTNHLDLPSIEELELALSRYSGAIIYVSHDSYFRGKLGGSVIQIPPADLVG